MRAFSTTLAIGLLLAIFASLPIERAWADAIDGEWCQKDGRQMSIHGSDIVTPGGARIKGDYSRHAYAYVVPAGEPGTGNTISMTLLSEDYVQVSAPHPVMATPTGQGEIWHRCGKQISRNGDFSPPGG